MSKLVTRFADWVDSHGEGAGDHMVAGMVLGAAVSGVLVGLVGLVVLDPVLTLAGFAVALVHGLYALAVL